MQRKAGDLLGRIMTDVGTLENFYVRSVAPPLVAVVVTAGLTYFFTRFNARLGWVYLVSSIILGVGVPLITWALTQRDGSRLVVQRAELQVRLVDGIQGLADITVFDQDHAYMAQLIQLGETCRKTQQRLASSMGITGAFSTILVNLGMLAMLIFAIPLVEVGKLPGVVLAVLSLAALAGFEAVIPLPLAAQTLSSSLESGKRLFDLVDTKPEVSDTSTARSRQVGNTVLQFSDLGFAYPGNPEFTLRGINFTLTPGKRMAIIGLSGAGKTTLFNLLMRFWDYSQGQILFDGIDLHAYPQDQTRQFFSLISQRPFFFNDTVRQNLLLARPAASEGELREAAQRAEIHDLILSLPGGYETRIGERGFRLSGGERQRLAMAIAFLKNSPIFLLDEPFANLDPQYEKLLLRNLLTLTTGRSILMTTHRLVGLEHMDEILVLDRGCILERGTHGTLLAANGFYRHLWDLQNSFLAEKTGT
jgi:ATP-binding cassette subfamily C protein CydC